MKYKISLTMLILGKNFIDDGKLIFEIVETDKKQKLLQE
jgi:hypothetical protein